MADTGGRAEATGALVDIEGVAEYLGVSVRHVRRLVFERRIPFIKWGHLLRFDLDEIATWIDGWRHGSVIQDRSDLAVDDRPVRRGRTSSTAARPPR